jgi:acetoacetyl-CoA synthetase
MHPPPIWFPGIKLNFAENLLNNGDPLRIAIHTCTEGGLDVEDVTWGALRSKVRQVADAMVTTGVKVGDRVAGVLSNRLETVVLCLASLSIGALWSTSSPDMGVKGVLDRLVQIRPKLLFAESDVLYNAKTHDLRSRNKEMARNLLSISEFSNIVVIARSKQVVEDQEMRLITWHTFLKRGRGRPLEFTQLPFSHPGFIVYSSGTVSSYFCPSCTYVEC